MTIDPTPGSVFGDYQLTRKLGFERSRDIWLAEHTTDGDESVLKIPRRDASRDEAVELAIQFLETVRKAGGHPNLPTLRETIASGDDVILVIDRVGGDRLNDVVEEESELSAEQVRSIGIDLCDAMSFLHRHEVSYYYLTPESVRLDSDRTPRIVSFYAAAEQASSAGATREHDGTYHSIDGAYESRAPETMGVSQHGDPGPWSVVYSIGKVLFQLITGHRFETSGIRPGQLDAAPPDYLDRIIERATAENPAERYATPAELKHALERRDPVSETATLYHVGGDRTCEIEAGGTIGRDNQPKTTISVESDHVSPVHCRLIRDANGEWRLEDCSTSGTYHHDGDSWEPLLSPNAREGRSDGDQAVDIAANGKRLEPGDTFALVDPNYDRKPWFVFRGED